MYLIVRHSILQMTMIKVGVEMSHTRETVPEDPSTFTMVRTDLRPAWAWFTNLVCLEISLPMYYLLVWGTQLFYLLWHH